MQKGVLTFPIPRFCAILALVMGDCAEDLRQNAGESGGADAGVAPPAFSLAAKLRRQSLFSLGAVFVLSILFLILNFSATALSMNKVAIDSAAFAGLGIASATASWLYFRLTPEAESGGRAGLGFAAVFLAAALVAGTFADLLFGGAGLREAIVAEPIAVLALCAVPPVACGIIEKIFPNNKVLSFWAAAAALSLFVMGIILDDGVYVEETVFSILLVGFCFLYLSRAQRQKMEGELVRFAKYEMIITVVFFVIAVLGLLIGVL